MEPLKLVVWLFSRIQSDLEQQMFLLFGSYLLFEEDVDVFAIALGARSCRYRPYFSAGSQLPAPLYNQLFVQMDCESIEAYTRLDASTFSLLAG